MDIRQLEVFITAAQFMNFTKASKQLNMVPSAVSHSISILEQELKTKLFKRDNNKLSLTPVGEDFLRDANRMLTIAYNAMNCGNFKGREKWEALRIGCVFPEFIFRYIPLFQNFHSEFPMIDIISMQYDSVILSRMLSNKQLDVAFGRREMFSMDSMIKWHSLYKDRFMVIVNRSHYLAGEDYITVPMLRKEKILVMNRSTNPGMFDMIQHLFLNYDMVPNISDDSNSHLNTLMLAAMNLGIVIIPHMNIHYYDLPVELVCKELRDPEAFHEIGIAWSKDNISQSLMFFLEKFGVII